MKPAKIWPAIAFSLQFAVLVTARHLPYDDDLQADSLVLVNKTRRDVEGSGDDDLHEIKPMPRGLITMERMEAAPDDMALGTFKHNIETLQDEGSGDVEAENPKTEPMIESIDEVFKDEEGMKEVIESITSQDATNLQTNDHNRHENTLNVIAGEENSPMTLEEPELIKHASEEVDDKVEGSGDEESSEERVSKKIVHPLSDTLDNLETAVTENPEVEELVHKENVHPLTDTLENSEKSASTENSEVEELAHKENVHPLTDTLENLETAVTENPEVEELVHKEHAHPLTDTLENLEKSASADNSDVEELAHKENVHPLTDTFQNLEIAVTENTEIEEPIVSSEHTIDVSTEPSIVPESELETSTESAVIEETSAQPDELTEQNLPLENDAEKPSTIPTDLIETSAAPVFPTSSEFPITPENNAETTTTETSSEIKLPAIPETTIAAEDTTTEFPEPDTTTDSFAEEINGTILIPAVMEEAIQVTAQAPAPQLESKTSSIGWYYVIGLLAVCLVILIAVVALRNRKRGHKLRTDIGPDRDTEKSLLSNGRFKEDSEDNNVKNNEIDPLVIKQNSQINKFEKSPNFSSPKNLNVQAQDKNIEKDNVLKSTQAIIEDEVDDAKKEVDDEKLEEKKKAVEELSPLIAEKVVVRTHVDLDSIPRKPIVINRNGHSYLAVPGGETKT